MFDIESNGELSCSQELSNIKLKTWKLNLNHHLQGICGDKVEIIQFLLFPYQCQKRTGNFFLVSAP